MRFRRFAIIALIYCLAMQESCYLIAHGLETLVLNPIHQDAAPADNPEMPILPEGEELKKEISDGVDESFFFDAFFVAKCCLTSPVFHDQVLPVPNRILLATLNRLLI